jgi:hypothetical protein
MGRAFAAGHLPLWNDFNYCGMPQIAITSPGWWYPPSLIFAWLPYSRTLAAIMILSQSLAGLGAYLLVISLGWTELAAILCGAVLAFSGYMFSLTGNYTLVATASWFSFCVLGTRKIALAQDERRLSLWIVATAAFVFMFVTAGRPEISAPGLVLLAGYVLYLIFFQTSPPLRIQRLVPHVKAMALGILFSMPAVLPAVEWLPWSRRAEGLQTSETLMFSANWYDLICLMASQPLGDLTLRNSELRVLIEPKNLGPFYGSAFVGSVVVAFACLGLARRGRLLYWLTVLTLAGSIVMALGSNMPLAELIAGHIPFLSILRFPSKLLFFTVFCLSILAARGLNDYLAGIAHFKIAIILWVVALASGCLLVSANAILLPFINASFANPEDLWTAQKAIGGGLFVWSALALACLGGLAWAQKRDRSRRWTTLAATLAVCIAVGSLFFHGFSRCHFGAPADFFSRPSVVAEQLKTIVGGELSATNQRFIDLYMEKFSVPPVFASPDRQVTTFQAYQYGRQVLRPFTNIDFALPSTFGFEGAMSGQYFYFLLNTYLASSQVLPPTAPDGRMLPESPLMRKTDLPLARLLKSTATKYVVVQDYRYVGDVPRAQNGDYRSQPNLTDRPDARRAAGVATRRFPVDVPLLDPALFDLVVRDPNMNYRIYKLKDTLPRAYLSFNWKVFGSRDELLQAMNDPLASGFDPGRLTLVEVSPSTLDAPTQSAPSETVALSIKEPQPEKLLIDCTNKQPALLVLADQYYPGWVARVDNEETPIIRCNGFLRAVALKAGTHHVEFLYQPKSLFYGFLLAGLAIVWSAALVFEAWGKGRAGVGSAGVAEEPAGAADA